MIYPLIGNIFLKECDLLRWCEDSLSASVAHISSRMIRIGTAMLTKGIEKVRELGYKGITVETKLLNVR